MLLQDAVIAYVPVPCFLGEALWRLWFILFDISTPFLTQPASLPFGHGFPWDNGLHLQSAPCNPQIQILLGLSEKQKTRLIGDTR